MTMTSIFLSLYNITTLFLFVLTRSAGSTFSTSALCPPSCDDRGADGRDRFSSHDIHRLSMCNMPMLLDFNVHAAFNNTDPYADIFACSTNLASGIFARDVNINDTTTCGIPLTHHKMSSFSVIRSGPSTSTNSSTAIDALRIIQGDLSPQRTACNSTTSIVIVGDSVVGVYAGASVPPSVLSKHVLERLVADIKSDETAGSVYIESCDDCSGMESLTMGVVIGDFNTLPLAHSAISAWSHGSCMTTKSTANSTAVPWQSFDLPLLSHPPLTTNKSAEYNYSSRRRTWLSPRSDCSTVQVKSGDSCASLATECGISATDFTKYNNDPSLCSTLTPGQHVCCSSGSLPDFAPKPQEDGTCATHTVVSDDTCSGVAVANSITVGDIGKWLVYLVASSECLSTS